jgi:hypothetical protein
VSEEARANGWRGFDNAGSVERVEGGYEYVCDGMPTMRGCGERVTVPRRWTKVGEKKSGWLVMYGQCFPDEPSDDGNGHDLDVVLTFCPECAAVVKRQDADR